MGGRRQPGDQPPPAGLPPASGVMAPGCSASGVAGAGARQRPAGAQARSCRCRRRPTCSARWRWRWRGGRGHRLAVTPICRHPGGGVGLSAAQVARLFAVGVPGVLPFSAMGLLLEHPGARPGRAGADQHAVPADGLPVGVVVPAEGHAARHRVIWPSYHLNQLAQDAVGMPSGAPPWRTCSRWAGSRWASCCLPARRLRRHG